MVNLVLEKANLHLGKNVNSLAKSVILQSKKKKNHTPLINYVILLNHMGLTTHILRITGIIAGFVSLAPGLQLIRLS